MENIPPSVVGVLDLLVNLGREATVQILGRGRASFLLLFFTSRQSRVVGGPIRVV